MNKIKCKICNNTIEKTIKSKENRLFYHCLVCDLIFLDKAFILPDENQKKRYLLHENSIENTGYINMFEDYINKCIIPYKNNMKSVLDFGCGYAPVLSRLLENRGLKTDIYDKFFYKNSYKKNRYEIITCTEVFEHLENPLFYMKLFKKLLINNGFFAVMTLFHPENDDLFLNWWYKEEKTHIVFLSKNTVLYLIKLLNMKMLYINEKNMFVLQKT